MERETPLVLWLRSVAEERLQTCYAIVILLLTRQTRLMKWKRLSKIQIFLLLIFGFFAVRYLFFRAPSEAQMISHMQENKAEFEQLRTMLQQDKAISSIAHGWINYFASVSSGSGKTELSEQRLAHYRELMKEIGIGSCVRNRNKQGGEYLRFGVFGGGMTDTSWSIGYVWSPTKLTPLVKSAYHELPRTGIHFSHIEGNWYIFHLH